MIIHNTIFRDSDEYVLFGSSEKFEHNWSNSSLVGAVKFEFNLDTSVIIIARISANVFCTRRFNHIKGNVYNLLTGNN